MMVGGRTILFIAPACLTLLSLAPVLGTESAQRFGHSTTKCSADVDCKDKCKADGCPYCVDGYCEHSACGKSCDADFECGGSCDACVGYQCGRSGSNPTPLTPATSCGITCQSSVGCPDPGCPVCSSNSTCVNDVCGWACRREEECGGQCGSCFEGLCISPTGRCEKPCSFDLDCGGTCSLCGTSGTCEPANPAPFPDVYPVGPFAPVPDTCNKGCFSNLDCQGKCNACSAGLCTVGTNKCNQACLSSADCVQTGQTQIEDANGPCVICTGEKTCTSVACGKACKDATECGGKCNTCASGKCTHAMEPSNPTAPEPDTCGHSCTANFDCSGSCYSCNAGICGKPDDLD